jgi:uncharacterized protein YbbC (DUF1343 family)/CubicO group peptidase (beta-lactamase class C family)
MLLVLVPALASAADFTAVDEAMRDAVASGEIPGAVVLVGRGDHILYLEAYGHREVDPVLRPMTTDTIFDIASLTKPFGTALAMMSLVERGRVKLDAPLGRYLKEFRGRAFEQLTIRRIMTHTAGLPAVPALGPRPIRFPEAARVLAHKPLDYPPGTGFQYSDEGFILLGEVVRRVSGQPLDRYLTTLLFRPLGLHDTMFRPPASLRDRIAPTEWANGHLLQGEVHDPRARQLGGVAGHAGMFSTALDLARICRMLVDGGSIAGRRVFKPSTIELMWSPSPGAETRGLGWDISSGFSRTMAPFFPAGSVGHTGFTGTAVWIDPPTRSYMLILTNRVHPNGGGAARVQELRKRVAAAVGSQIFDVPVVVAASTTPPSAPATAADGDATDDERPADGVPPPASARGAAAGRGAPRPPRGQVRSGLDVLVDQRFALLQGKTIGLVTNQTGVDRAGRRAIDLLARAPGVRLAAIFTPEHGVNGDVDADVPNGRDAATGLPIWSLYGPTRRPSPEMLRGLDALVFDIQDLGVRYYTYLATLVNVMEEAARLRLPVIVLDRPDPLNGRVVEGPLMDPDFRSFTAPHTIPVRTGLTIGEFGRMVAAERRIPVALTVVALAGWDRRQWFDETGLPWVNPSPNIRSLDEALLYSGIGLLEATNLSVGRGTETPFEVVGAPWIEPRGLADAMNRRRLPGVRFEPVWFTPSSSVYARTGCGGVRLVVTDRDAIRPVTVALALARTLRERHRDQFRPENIQNLLVNRSTMWAFLRGEPLWRMLARVDTERSSFLNRRASYLIYP